MESCDADVLEIGGDEVDTNKTSTSVQQLTAKVETGTFLLELNLLKHCSAQTTGSTWWRGRIVRPILITTLTI